jgi:hypothetical protein
MNTIVFDFIVFALSVAVLVTFFVIAYRLRRIMEASEFLVSYWKKIQEPFLVKNVTNEKTESK